LESRLKSESFDSSIGFLAVQELGKITNFRKITKFVFLAITFEPDTLENQWKCSISTFFCGILPPISYYRGGQLAARRPHAVRYSVFSGPRTVVHLRYGRHGTWHGRHFDGGRKICL